LKTQNRNELVGLGILTGIMTALIIAGHPISAAPSASNGSCTISFSGSLTSLQMSPVGVWRLTSSACSVTGQSEITSGTFTGNFTSTHFNGMVSGTWSTNGNTQTLVASNPDFTLSVSTDQVVGQTPVVGSAYQGVLSGTGTQTMLAVGTAGQISLK
jgi:hypothetical protein